MARYWLKTKLMCAEEFPCSQCSKVMKCVDYATGKSNDCPVSSREDVPPKPDPQKRHWNKEHQAYLTISVPDKAFKDARVCKIKIPCNCCHNFLLRCFPPIGRTYIPFKQAEYRPPKEFTLQKCQDKR